MPYVPRSCAGEAEQAVQFLGRAGLGVQLERQRGHLDPALADPPDELGDGCAGRGPRASAAPASPTPPSTGTARRPASRRWPRPGERACRGTRRCWRSTVPSGRCSRCRGASDGPVNTVHFRCGVTAIAPEATGPDESDTSSANVRGPLTSGTNSSSSSPVRTVARSASCPSASRRTERPLAGPPSAVSLTACCRPRSPRRNSGSTAARMSRPRTPATTADVSRRRAPRIAS